MPQTSRKIQAVPSPSAMSKKRAAFKRVAAPRLANVLVALEFLAACADPVRYEILPSDIEKIRESLTSKVADVVSRYESGRRKPVVEFD